MSGMSHFSLSVWLTSLSVTMSRPIHVAANGIVSFFFVTYPLVPQMVKNLPAMQKTQVWSLDQEDNLENGMATHSSILAWRILWREEPGGLQSKGYQRVGHDWVTLHFHTLLYLKWIKPTRYYCIEQGTLLKFMWQPGWELKEEFGGECLHVSTRLRSLHAGQEATVRTGHGTIDWFQIGKGVRQGCILAPCLFNSYAENIMRNAGLEEAQAAMKIARLSITSDMQMTPPLWQKVKRN